jgi:vacuolar-type H+-ATPase subunit F/Vma7
LRVFGFLIEGIRGFNAKSNENKNREKEKKFFLNQQNIGFIVMYIWFFWILE